MNTRIPPLLSLLFGAGLLAAAPVWPDSRLADDLSAELAVQRLSEVDLEIPAGIGLPYTLPVIEELFPFPTRVPDVSSRWLDQMETSSSTIDLYSVGYDILFDTTSIGLRPIVGRPVS